MMVLGLIALLVFGPERLPEVALQAARLVKKLRGMAETARTDFGGDFEPHMRQLRELQELRDLNPRKLVKDYVLDPANGDGSLSGLTNKRRPRPPSAATGGSNGRAAAGALGAAGTAAAASGSAAVPDVDGFDVDARSGSDASLEGPPAQGTNGSAAPAQDGPAVPRAMANATQGGLPPFDPDAT